MLEGRTFKILIVDDEVEVLNSLAMTLNMAKQFDCDVTTVNDSKQALVLIEEQEFDLILSDYRMPDVTGVEVLTAAREKDPTIARILITGFSDVKVAMDAINQAQVHNYLEKPWDNDELRQAIAAALERRVERKGWGKPISSVTEALDMIAEVQKKISQTSEREETMQDVLEKDSFVPENEMVFEFKSVQEFNKFSFEVKKMHNVHIDDTYIFEDKYVIKLSVDPKSVMRIM